MRRLISIYERNFAPYPANLNMVAYTRGMRETIRVSCEVMVLHYADEFGRFYVYEDNWRKITNQTLDNIFSGKVKPKLLKRILENENKNLLKLLAKHPRQATGQLIKTVNQRIVRLISAGDPEAYCGRFTRAQGPLYCRYESSHSSPQRW